MVSGWLHSSKRPQRAGVVRVIDMLNSPHLSGMSAEAKHCALLMALEAEGTEVEALLQDAVARQRRLDREEEEREGKVRRFEAAMLEENRAVQTELDRLTSRYMERLQANLDLVARRQDEFRAWQKQKQQESQRMTDAISFCVPHGNRPQSATLSVVLEPLRAARR